MELVAERAYYKGRINLLTGNEIAAIIPDETSRYRSRDIVLADRTESGRASNLTKIPATHPAYMLLHYILLFPHGDYSWGYNIKLYSQREDQRLTL